MTMLRHRKREVSSSLAVNGMENNSKVDSISLVTERHLFVFFFSVCVVWRPAHIIIVSHSATVFVSCKHVAFVGNRICGLESCR